MDQIRTDLEIVRDDLVAIEPAKPPHPNFWWAILWCVAFVFATQIPGVIVSVVVLFVLLMGTGKSADLTSVDALMNSAEMQTATMYGFLCAELLVILVPLGMLLLVVGRDWRRQLAVRRPSTTHL